MFFENAMSFYGMYALLVKLHRERPGFVLPLSIAPTNDCTPARR